MDNGEVRNEDLAKTISTLKNGFSEIFLQLIIELIQMMQQREY